MSDLTHEVPVIDLRMAADPAECLRVAQALSDVGCLVVRGTNGDAITPELTRMMVEYFRQPEAVKTRHVRPDIQFQVGRTPSFFETARPRPDRTAGLKPGHEITPYAGADPKERFMAQVGPRPTTKRYAAMFAAENVVPDGFPRWGELVNGWGDQAIEVMMTVARMAAIGFGLPAETFVGYLTGGQHLYAPTGSNLSKYGKVGTVLAAAHGDLNFMSVHGKATHPGLRVWKRDGTSLWVKVPDGCMLVQAGMQFEHLTGGTVLEGLHEVVVTEATLAAEATRFATAMGLVPWRVSTTLFGHAMSDLILEPIAHFATPEAVMKYPRITAGAQVEQELELIGLAASASKN